MTSSTIKTKLNSYVVNATEDDSCVYLNRVVSARHIIDAISMFYQIYGKDYTVVSIVLLPDISK